MACGLIGLALAGAEDTAVEVGARIAVLALLALVAALVRGWSSLVPVAVAALGAVYAAHLGLDDIPLDSKAPLLAAGLYLTAELAYWSLDEREPARAEDGGGLRRVGVVAVLGLAALATAGVVLASADISRAQGLAVDLLGAAAAAAVLLVLFLLARRQSG